MASPYGCMRERVIANSVVAPEGMGYIVAGEPCWLWTGATKRNRSGQHYGRITVRMKRGPRKGKPVSQPAHRVVLVEFKDRVMSGRQKGCHLCNNTLCVNPAHLVGGTQRSNVRQCVRQGRHWSGFKGSKSA